LDLPEYLTIFGVEADNVLRAEVSQLPPALARNDNRRRVAGTVRQGPPDLGAGGDVEGNEGRVLAADLDDQPAAVDTRRAGMNPLRHGALEVLDGIAGPNHFAAVSIETKQMSTSAKGVHLAVVDRRRCARPVAVLHLAVANVVSVRPEDLAGGGVQADDAFLFARRL